MGWVRTGWGGTGWDGMGRGRVALGKGTGTFGREGMGLNRTGWLLVMAGDLVRPGHLWQRAKARESPRCKIPRWIRFSYVSCRERWCRLRRLTYQQGAVAILTETGWGVSGSFAGQPHAPALLVSCQTHPIASALPLLCPKSPPLYKPAPTRLAVGTAL